MIDFMPHSGKKPHVWKFRSDGYRQLLIEHGWGLRGGYASKFFGGYEYMMTINKRWGPYVICQLRRKDDFWADISGGERNRHAQNVRSRFHIVQSTGK